MAAGETPETPATPAAAPPSPGAEPKPPSALQRSIKQRETTIVNKQQELAARERQLDETVAQRVEREVAARLAKFKDDPIAQLESMGFDKPTIASRLLKGNAPQPDEMAKQALQAAEELKKQLAEERRQTANAQAERAVADEGFSGKYEHLELEWTRTEFVREVHGVVGELRAKGHDPSQYSYQDICAFLNKRAQSRDKKREAAKAERAKKAGAQAPTTDGSNGPGQGEAPKTASTTTLGKGLGTRQSINGKPGHLMTDAELAKHVEAEITRARAS